MPVDNDPWVKPEGQNVSFTKKGPGRVRPPSPFSKSRQLVLDAIKDNPINRLSSRELVRLEQTVKRLKLRSTDALHNAAETIISQRRVIVAGE